jgi:hypothetical protein
MSAVAAWKWFLPEAPSLWQWFFSREMSYEGKNCDSREEVLHVAEDSACSEFHT